MPNVIPVIAMSDMPRPGRDADRFARGVRAYADILRARGVVIASTHWNRSSDSPSVILEAREHAAPDLALGERCATLLQSAGLSVEPRRSWPREHALWTAFLDAHHDAAFPLLHVSVPARFGSDLMIVTARALEPLRREAVLLVGLSAVFGEALRGRSASTETSGAPWITDIIQGVPV